MLPQITKSVLWDTFYEIMALSGNSVKYRMKGEVVMNIAEHNVLTLDYWRDEVSYEGITLPSGNIGCAALNISDAVIAELKQICQPLQAVIDAVGKCKLKPDQLAPTGDCVLQILALLQKENAFPFLDYPYYIKRIPEIFTDQNEPRGRSSSEHTHFCRGYCQHGGL